MHLEKKHLSIEKWSEFYKNKTNKAKNSKISSANFFPVCYSMYITLNLGQEENCEKQFFSGDERQYTLFIETAFNCNPYMDGYL